MIKHIILKIFFILIISIIWYKYMNIINEIINEISWNAIIYKLY